MIDVRDILREQQKVLHRIEGTLSVLVSNYQSVNKRVVELELCTASCLYKDPDTVTPVDSVVSLQDDEEEAERLEKKAVHKTIG